MATGIRMGTRRTTTSASAASTAASSAVRATAVLAALALVGLCATVGGAASSPADRIGEATQVLREMSEQTDVGAMADLLKTARGVAVFPSVIKAGLFVGGRYGEGLVLRRDPDKGKWFGPTFVKITGASWGLQLGVQATALVLVIANERGLKGFEGNNVTLGGDISVAAGPIGRHAEAGTDIGLKAAIYSYSMTKGVFAGFSLEGTMIEEDEAANESYWGSAITPEKALGREAVDVRVRGLVQELERLLAQAK